MPIVELQTANGSQNPSVTTFVRYISLMRSLENDMYEWQIEGQIKKKGSEREPRRRWGCADPRCFLSLIKTMQIRLFQ